MAVARLVSVLFGTHASAVACGTSPFGLKTHEHLFLPASVDAPQRNVALPCCGSTMYRDVDLSVDGIEIDLTNPSGAGVDGFVTSAGSEKLFDGP